MFELQNLEMIVDYVSQFVDSIENLQFERFLTLESIWVPAAKVHAIFHLVD